MSRYPKFTRTEKNKLLESFYGTKVTRLLIGQCHPCVKHNAAKVLVKTWDLDKHLRMHFYTPVTYYAHDPNKIAEDGDIVLIKELEKKKTTLITHALLKVIHRLGDIEDPLTKKKVTILSHSDPQYRDNQEELIKLYGENENRFRYDKAPPRGWQRDKRDFAHVEHYVKYHESKDEEQPYAIPP